MTLHAAIAGLGRWGRRLVDSVQGEGVEPSTRIRFVKGWTRTAAPARDFAQARGFALVDDFASLLADPAIDAIVLATPHSLHVEQAIACARAGKHVYVEKPLALTLADARRAAQACAEAGVVMAVGHNRRFIPAVRALVELARSGEMGQLLHVEGNFSGSFGLEYDANVWRANTEEAPGGGLTLMGVHTLDAMIAMMGPVTRLSAISLRQVVKIELDDTSSATLRFASGASGYLSTLTATPRSFRLQVFGTRAWAHVLDHEILEVCGLDGKVVRRTFQPEDAERIAMEHFGVAATGGAPFPIALPEVLNGIAAVQAFVDSAREGGRALTLET